MNGDNDNNINNNVIYFLINNAILYQKMKITNE